MRCVKYILYICMSVHVRIIFACARMQHVHDVRIICVCARMAYSGTQKYKLLMNSINTLTLI